MLNANMLLNEFFFFSGICVGVHFWFYNTRKCSLENSFTHFPCTCSLLSVSSFQRCVQNKINENLSVLWVGLFEFRKIQRNTVTSAFNIGLGFMSVIDN